MSPCGLAPSAEEWDHQSCASEVQQSKGVTALQGYAAVGTGAHAPGALLATAASLFPDPLQTANSEMLLNTADPLSSINSTTNILDTFEERERQA